MKYFPRLKQYKAANVTFNPNTLEAHSYAWWCFVKRINGQIVFNEHKYSPTTSRHQSKVKALLAELNINIDQYVDVREGL